MSNGKLILQGPGKLVRAGAARVAGGGLDMTAGLHQLVGAWRDYQTVREAEMTRRAQISADRDVRLQAIHEQAEVLRLLVRETFRERADNFERGFRLLEQGFAQHNDQQINAALAVIVEQTRVNPMAQAAQLMQSLNDPKVDVIDI